MARYPKKSAVAAKSLLLEKGCDTCSQLNHCTYDGKEYCGPSILSEDLRRSFDKECEHPPLPTERTCARWQSSNFGLSFVKAMLPVVRRTYPNMIAKELVEVSSIKVGKDIYRLGNDGD